MKKVKTWKVAILLSAIVIFVMVQGYVSNNNTHSDYKSAIEYKHAVKEYVAKDGTLVHYNNVLKVELGILKQINDSLAEYIDKLDVKKVETITIYDTHFQVDTMYIPFEEPVDSVHFIKVFELDTADFFIRGEVTELGLFIDSLGMTNRVGITTSYKKKGLFKKELIVTITNSNKLIKIDGISAFVIEDKKRWWKKDGVKVIVGAIVGGILTYKIVK